MWSKTQSHKDLIQKPDKNPGASQYDFQYKIWSLTVNNPYISQICEVTYISDVLNESLFKDSYQKSFCN